MYNWVYPNWFFLLLLIPILVFWDIYSFKKLTPKILFSNLALLKAIQKRNSIFKYIPTVLKCILITLIALALARPRFTTERREHTTFGVDIVLAIDVSGSMLAVDFRPQNRMEAAKNVALEFINKRENDRFGIVTFASYAYTLSPLTSDFGILNTIVSQIKVDEQQSGTAIGNGIAISTLRLKDSPAESKVIILLTDGVNNSGQIDPMTAAEIAKTFGIKIYAIGIGTKGLVDFPFQHPVFGTQYRKVNIDFDIDAMHKIAQIGGTGRAYEARNTQQLREIFEQIDQLEKTEIKTNVHYEHREMFIYFIYWAVGVLLLMILTRSLFRVALP